MTRIITYVDGFNLYHGVKALMKNAKSNQSWKWIDLEALSRKIMPSGNLVAVKYFTAKVSELENDRAFVQRQQMYLRALKMQSNIFVFHGQFMRQKKRVPLAISLNVFQFMIARSVGLDLRRHPDGNISIPVWRIEEKATDVNLGVHLVADAFRDSFDTALVISNDSDLREPIRLVTQEIKKKVVLANPRGHMEPTALLAKFATATRQIRVATVLGSQLPSTLHDRNGEFQKPASW